MNILVLLFCTGLFSLRCSKHSRTFRLRVSFGHQYLPDGTTRGKPNVRKPVAPVTRRRDALRSPMRVQIPLHSPPRINEIRLQTLRNLRHEEFRRSMETAELSN